MDSVYKKYENDRNNCTYEIIEHIKNGGDAVIAAGPGTGKTYLFKQIIQNFQLSPGKKVLVLSFINALVDDLKRELCNNENAEVRTLHSFARKILGNSVPAIEPRLPEIIAEDLLIHKECEYGAKEIKAEVRRIEKLFHTMEIDLPENEEIKEFYENRREFYNRVSFNDIVYSLVSHLKQNPEQMPKEYDLLIIDEFQDFCLLEAKLVEILSQNSRATVIVGDDDQIVYDKATPDLLRQKYLPPDTEYRGFTLPFCGRCTEGIVNFINEAVKNAKNMGKLKGRIEKEYKYFRSGKKDEVSQQYPKIICRDDLEDGQIPMNIHSYIQRACKECKDEKPEYETFMVIAPIKNKIKKIEDSFVKLGYKNVLVNKGRDYDDLTYGMGILLNANRGADNFGWRLVVGKKYSENLKEVVKASIENPSDNISNHCPDFKEAGEKVLTLLRELVKTKQTCVRTEKFKSLQGQEKKKHKSFPGEKVSALIDFWDTDPEINWLNTLMNDLQTVKEVLKDGGNQQNLFPGVKIILTTPQSSKGLSAKHVFITDCTKEIMFKEESNKEICTLLVAISRAEKSLTIFTKKNSAPSILSFSA